MADPRNHQGKIKSKRKTGISKELLGKIGTATAHRKQHKANSAKEAQELTLLTSESNVGLEILSEEHKKSYIAELIQTRDYLSLQLAQFSDEDFEDILETFEPNTGYNSRDEYLVLIESLTAEVLEEQLNTYDDYKYAMAHLQLAIEHLQEIQAAHQIQSESNTSVDLLEEDFDDGLSSIDFASELEQQATIAEQTDTQAGSEITEENAAALKEITLEIIKAHLAFYEKLKTYQTYLNADHGNISKHHQATLDKARQIIKNQFKRIGIDTILEALKAHEESREILTLDKIAEFTNLASQFANTDNRGLLVYLHIKEALPDFPDFINELAYLLSSMDVAWHKANDLVSNQSSIVSATNENLESTITNLQSLQKVKEQLSALGNNSALDEEINAIGQLNDPQHIQEICTLFGRRCEELRINAQRFAIEANIPKNQENTELKYKADAVQREYNKWLAHNQKFSADQFGTQLENLNKILKQYSSLLQTLSTMQISFGHTLDTDKLKEIQKLHLKINALYKKIIENYSDSLDIIEEILSGQLDSQSLNALKPFFMGQKVQSTLNQANALARSLKENPSAKSAFAQQLKLGILFNKRGAEQDANFYRMLSLGMLADFSENEVLEMGIDGLNNCSHPDDIENALLFIQYALLNDTDNQTMSFDEQETHTIEELNTALSKITSDRHQPSIIAIKQLIEQKHNERILSFSNTISSLSLEAEPFIPHQDFSRMIFTQIYKLQKCNEHERKKICNEFFAWINNANDMYFQMKNNDLSNPLHAALSFIDEAEVKGINANACKETIFRKKLSTPQADKTSANSITIPPISEYSVLLQKIEKIARGELRTEEADLLSQQLITMIEAAHQNELAQMSTSELSAAGNRVDRKNIEKGLYTQPQSLHFNRTEQITIKIYALLATLVLNQYKNGKISPREKVKDCKRVYDFYNKMLNDAYEQHQYYAFEDIFYAQAYSSTPKFSENDAEREQYVNLFKHGKKYLAKLKAEHQSAPSADIYTHRFAKAQQSMNSDLLEKYLLIGRDCAQFINAQAKARQARKPTSSDNLEAFADSVLFECYQEACSVSPTTLAIAVDDDLMQQAILSQSSDIRPKDLPKAKSLTHFSSMSDLKAYLKICADREWGYHLTDSPPQVEILNFIKNYIDFTIQKSAVMPSITEIFELLDYMDEIQMHETGKPIEKFSVYKIIFDAYDQAIQVLPEAITNSMLKDFHSSLEQSPHFLNIVENPAKWHEILSQKRACYNSAISFENHLLDKIESAPDAEIENEESSSFVNLLNIVLSGKTPAIFGTNTSIVSGNFAAMMSDKEYWVTPYDPEFVEPSQIFLSLSQEKQSALENFSAKALNEQFCQGLPWALKLDSIDKLSRISALESPNLLNTATPLEKETQLMVMQYFLVCFDIMGKLCGRDGAFALKNYDAIDAMISNLEKIQADLKTEACLSPDFTKKISSQLQSIKTQNQQLNIMSQQSKKDFFSLNIDVNNFCHLNEVLVHQLLGIPFQTSILSPQEAAPPHRDLIAKAMQKPNSALGFYALDKENKAHSPMIERTPVAPKIKTKRSTKRTKQ